jgi:hypothetical protein
MRSLMGWLVLTLMAPLFSQVGLQLSPQPLPVRPNLVRNGSFEQVEQGLPVGWRWDKRNTDATAQVVEGEAATGQRCLKLTSTTPFATDTYGLLRYEGGVPVKPGTIYTLSVRYKVTGGYKGFVGGGKNWRVRLPFEDTGGEWRRAAITFATASDETLFELVITVEAPTDGLYIDDLKLEEGREPSFFVPAEPLDRPLLPLGELPERIYLNTPNGRARWNSICQWSQKVSASRSNWVGSNCSSKPTCRQGSSAPPFASPSHPRGSRPSKCVSNPRTCRWSKPVVGLSSSPGARHSSGSTPSVNHCLAGSRSWTLSSGANKILPTRSPPSPSCRSLCPMWRATCKKDSCSVPFSSWTRWSRWRNGSTPSCAKCWRASVNCPLCHAM